MPKRTTKANSKPTTETDDAVLRDIAASITKLKVPIDAFVIGEPVRVAAIEYSGNARRGLVAVCRRAERDYQVNLADVLFDEGSTAEKAATTYRAWLGLSPHAPAEQPARRHKADPADLDLSRDIELVVLASKSNALRCRVLGTQREVTLRTAANALAEPVRQSGRPLQPGGRRGWSSTDRRRGRRGSPLSGGQVPLPPPRPFAPGMRDGCERPMRYPRCFPAYSMPPQSRNFAASGTRPLVPDVIQSRCGARRSAGA